jgi:hypothetical protein
MKAIFQRRGFRHYFARPPLISRCRRCRRRRHAASCADTLIIAAAACFRRLSPLPL